MFSLILADSVLLTNTSLINLLIAVAVFSLGLVILFHDQKRLVNQLAFLCALFLGHWTLSATLADVMRDDGAALFWTRTAIIGPFFFSAFFVIFSDFFPDREKPRKSWWYFLVMFPAIIVAFFSSTSLNVVSITLRDWGTDFTPGILYYLGLPYGVGYLAFASWTFFRKRRLIVGKVKREQVSFVFLASAVVIVSLIVTNVILPIVFNYTRATVFGPAASLMFVILMSYAIFAKGAMNIKAIATEFFCYLLIFLSAVQALYSDEVGEIVRNGIALVFVSGISVLLIRTVRKEVFQREEMERLTAELALRNEKLREMDKIKSDFISIASHQLRTPISVIKGYLTLILDGAYGKVDGPMKDKVTAMIDMAERLVVMINEMLNVSRIERNKIDYTCKRFDVARTVGGIVEEMQGKATEKKLKLQFSVLDESVDAIAYADMDKVKEVSSNLVDNAIKYSVSGTIEVMVTSRPGSRDVLVTVADEGFGIAPEDEKHMFEKFYRSSTTEVARLTGTGLGLYVCRMFLRDMGGDIWIERTAIGKGTVFAFSVPAEPAGRCDPREEIHPQAP